MAVSGGNIPPNALCNIARGIWLTAMEFAPTSFVGATGAPVMSSRSLASESVSTLEKLKAAVNSAQSSPHPTKVLSSVPPSSIDFGTMIATLGIEPPVVVHGGNNDHVFTPKPQTQSPTTIAQQSSPSQKMEHSERVEPHLLNRCAPLSSR